MALLMNRLSLLTSNALTAAAAIAVAAPALGTVLTFDTSPLVPTYTAMPQDYGDNASADSMPAAGGGYQNLYQQGNGWTPNVQVGFGTGRTGEFPQYFSDAEWPGVCFLWSGSFRTGFPIGENAANAMPAGFEYFITFTPTAGNRGVVLNSFVLDDYAAYFDGIPHVIQWRVTRGSPSGAVLASGTETFSNGQNVFVSTGMSATQASLDPLFLVIKRMEGTEDDLAIDDISFDETGIPSTSYNTGSLGTGGDAQNTENVVLDLPGAIAAGSDHATSYAGGQRTTLPWMSALNPPPAQPFTIEFWARPESSDNDDAPLANRIAAGNRSGWVFFQRDEATGYNFRMYDGNGSSVGWDLTGGPFTFNKWCHVVAVWNGSSARLYVNGTLAGSTNAAGKSGIYVASDSAVFSVGSLFDGGSPSTGLVDEVAFYAAALSPARILAHYQTAASPIAGAYSALVKSDGAIEYLQQNPPEIDISLSAGNPVVRFTGVLSQSAGLAAWEDLNVASPWTILPETRPGSLFFRVHR